LAACIVTVFGIERLGYRLTLVLVLSFLLKVVERRGWLLTASLAFILAFGSFFLFYTLLRVPLPQGPFGF
jgi:ATP/ADP translocase